MNNEAATIALEFARVAGAVTSLRLDGGDLGDFAITTGSGELITSLDLAGDTVPLQDLIREMRRGQNSVTWTPVLTLEDRKAARELSVRHLDLLRRLNASPDVLARAEANLKAISISHRE